MSSGVSPYQLGTESRVRLVHILAALGVADGGLIGELRDRYDFDDADWRAALAEWDSQREPLVGTRQASGALLSVDGASEALWVRSFFLAEAEQTHCYFEAADLSAVKDLNERAQIPFLEIAEVVEMTPDSV